MKQKIKLVLLIGLIGVFFIAMVRIIQRLLDWYSNYDTTFDVLVVKNLAILNLVVLLCCLVMLTQLYFTIQRVYLDMKKKDKLSSQTPKDKNKPNPV